METPPTVINPIQVVFENTPILVFTHYLLELNSLIGKLEVSKAQKISFRQTISRHYNGQRGAGSMRTMNIFLRRAIEESWPTEIAFFEADGEEMFNAAMRTSKKMTKQFEQLLAEQKAALAS